VLHCIVRGYRGKTMFGTHGPPDRTFARVDVNQFDLAALSSGEKSRLSYSAGWSPDGTLDGITGGTFEATHPCGIHDSPLLGGFRSAMVFRSKDTTRQIHGKEPKEKHEKRTHTCNSWKSAASNPGGSHLPKQ